MVSLTPRTMFAPSRQRWTSCENEFGWILKVGGDPDDGPALGLEQGMSRRAQLAEIAGIDNQPDARVASAQRPDDVGGPIGRPVVDEDDLEVVGNRAELHEHGIRDGLGILFLVEARNDDRDFGPVRDLQHGDLVRNKELPGS